MPRDSHAEVRVRAARRSDAARLADLAAQLGYPTTNRQMARRLSLVLQDKKAACFVARKTAGGEVVGWLHVSSYALLEVQRRAEINALVVDERSRGQGAGRLLLDAAERWARARGATSMSVRSNVIRERAHAFYLRNGYQHYKTQKAFAKQL